MITVLEFCKFFIYGVKISAVRYLLEISFTWKLDIYLKLLKDYFFHAEDYLKSKICLNLCTSLTFEGTCRFSTDYKK